MKNKLFLSEDEDIIVAEEPVEVVSEPIEEPVEIVEAPDENNLSTSSMINQMIKGEWDAIDLYNSVAATLAQTEGNEEVIATIDDIVQEEYVHVGQLQKVLQMINGQAARIEDGAQEAENDASGGIVG